MPHEIRQDEAIILVPEQRVLRLRMALAEDGLPAGGTVGYEIFDNSDSLGTTSFVQTINKLRAAEGELARSTRTIDCVQTPLLSQNKIYPRAKLKTAALV